MALAFKGGVSVATPLPLRAMVTSGLPLMWKTTLPVGVPPPNPVAVTVAVMTASPYTAFVLLEASTVLVLALLTVWPPLSVPLLALYEPLAA